MIREFLRRLVGPKLTAHQWQWAKDAPEPGVPNDQRKTSIVETCTLCGITAARDHYGNKPWSGKRFLSCMPFGTPQPICPETCEEAAAVLTAFMELNNRNDWRDPDLRVREM